jgi:hypothetical protein
MGIVSECIMKQNSTLHGGEEEGVENLLVVGPHPWQGQQKRQRERVIEH